MRYIVLLFIMVFIAVCFGHAAAPCDVYKPSYKNIFTTDTIAPHLKNKNNHIEDAWNVFLKNFTAGIDGKDTAKIAALTSGDFYDGGGGTVQQWLQSEVFLNEKTFTRYKNLLKKGAAIFKGSDGTPYRATGKNRSGDLFFEYKKGQWLFGGMVGD